MSYQKLVQISRSRRASGQTFYIVNAPIHLFVVEYIVQRCKIQHNTPSHRTSSGPGEWACQIKKSMINEASRTQFVSIRLFDASTEATRAITYTKSEQPAYQCRSIVIFSTVLVKLATTHTIRSSSF
ncbi:Piso0_005885 [Millerozyma farinosa CBS 7064]|uniref:Piso0_005885 protein n=1 Tax=Pichia sorbitophila (strain ATCC MYA-4447 / BCRC 22081 / CBS 7064 / NBRC 10061 / NRRL Y-12695) TaxID=559304 RepID=G8Y077_PICSO|nr:Piso0_005885 [Millerozyma farinosa CBS 7064]